MPEVSSNPKYEELLFKIIKLEEEVKELSVRNIKLEYDLEKEKKDHVSHNKY